jgi:hypothetical protein
MQPYSYMRKNGTYTAIVTDFWVTDVATQQLQTAL